MRVSPSSETFPLRQSGYSTEWQHTYTHHHLHTHTYAAIIQPQALRVPAHEALRYTKWWKMPDEMFFLGRHSWKGHTHIIVQVTGQHHTTWQDMKLLETHQEVRGCVTSAHWRRMYKMSGQHGHMWNTWQAHWGHSYTNVDTLHKCCKSVISLPPTLIDPRELPKCVPLDMLFPDQVWTKTANFM